HNTPGLVGALLVGVSAAKALGLALGVPVVAVNHVAAHVFACRLAAGRDIFPCVGLVVSGGHTALFRCDTALSLKLLGSTRDDARLEFSFSGLKTAVLYACHGQDVSRAEPPPPGQKRADLAASFQEAVVDVLVGKCEQALRKTGLTRLAVGGGVSANKRLRAGLEAMCAKEGAELFIPPP